VQLKTLGITLKNGLYSRRKRMFWQAIEIPTFHQNASGRHDEAIHRDRARPRQEVYDHIVTGPEGHASLKELELI
jgi:hypothetical protein